MMYEGNQPASWQKLIDLHEKQLEEHRRFLSSLQGEAQNVSGANEFMEECLAQTEVMMRNFKQSADKFLVATTKSPQHDSQRAKKIPTGPRLDPSGLFVRDTKPTPVAELLRQTVIRTKRKIRESDEQTPPSPLSSQPDEERQAKRVRTEDRSTTENRGDVENEQHEKSKATNGHDPDATEEPIEVPAAGDSFVQEVEEHLKKKALKKLKRQEKKRKRESAISDVPMPGVEQDTTQTGVKPQKKKRKKATQTLLDEREVGIDSATPLQSGQTTPQAEKGKNKRLSPASEYLSISLQQVEGRRKSKRTKTNEVS